MSLQKLLKDITNPINSLRVGRLIHAFVEDNMQNLEFIGKDNYIIIKMKEDVINEKPIKEEKQNVNGKPKKTTQRTEH